MQGRHLRPAVGPVHHARSHRAAPALQHRHHRYAYVFLNRCATSIPRASRRAAPGPMFARTTMTARPGANQHQSGLERTAGRGDGSARDRRREGPSNPLGPLAPFSEMSEDSTHRRWPRARTPTRGSRRNDGPVQGGSYARESPLNHSSARRLQTPNRAGRVWRTYYEVSTSLVDLAASVPMALGNGRAACSPRRTTTLPRHDSGAHSRHHESGFIPKKRRVFFSEVLGAPSSSAQIFPRRASFSIEVGSRHS